MEKETDLKEVMTFMILYVRVASSLVAAGGPGPARRSDCPGSEGR